MYDNNISKTESKVSAGLLTRITLIAKAILVVGIAIVMGAMIYSATGTIQKELFKALSIVIALYSLSLIHLKSVNH